MRWVVRVHREAVRRNIRQGVDPRAVNARPHRCRVQTADLPDMGLRSRGATRVISERDVGCVLVNWIENEPRDIKIGDHTSAANRVQTGKRRGSGGSEPKSAVVIADDPVVIVLRGNANRANRNASDERRLTDDHICRALRTRAIQTIGAKVDGIVWASWPQRGRTIEVDCVRAGNAVRRSRSRATEKRPRTERPTCEAARITYLGARLVKIGMVHRGGRALVYHGKASVSVVGVKPDRSSRKALGPVILRATDGDVRIGRMHRYALKLSSSQGGVVLSQPRVAAIN